jgi:FKBP-type peptidyl-prolyl cis-trans isomerase
VPRQCLRVNRALSWSVLSVPWRRRCVKRAARVDRCGALGLDGLMTDDRTKPEIDAPVGPAPEELVIRDLIVGDGAEAKPGDTVTVHYAGVEYESGEEFDSSWNRGESIQFPLRGLIQGWQDGIPGMKEGGRRELVIPPHLAYGPAGGHFLGGKTLIFVIDLISVG